jgi:hypothetical protein
LASHIEVENRQKAFDNRVLRKTLAPTTDEITGEWSRLDSVQLHDLYSSDIFWVIKSRKMRWAGRVACMGEMRGAYRVLVHKHEETTWKT